MPAAWVKIDVNRNLPRPTFDHQLLKKLRMFEEGLAVSYEHGHYASRVADDLQELTLPARSSGGISTSPPVICRPPPRALEAPVGVEFRVVEFPREEQSPITSFGSACHLPLRIRFAARRSWARQRDCRR